MLEHALSVAAAKAKIAGLVVAAAAIGGTTAVVVAPAGFLPTGSETTVATDATPTATPDVTESPAPEATPTDGASPDVVSAVDPTLDPTATRTPLPCPSDVANHGAYVSMVAHDHSVSGREHGLAVSEAAQSDCGKGAADTTDATDEASPEPTDSPEADAAEQSDTQDAGGSPQRTHKAKHANKGKRHNG